jgi:hypothetical protein
LHEGVVGIGAMMWWGFVWMRATVPSIGAMRAALCGAEIGMVCMEGGRVLNIFRLMAGVGGTARARGGLSFQKMLSSI